MGWLTGGESWGSEAYGNKLTPRPQEVNDRSLLTQIESAIEYKKTKGFEERTANEWRRWIAWRYHLASLSHSEWPVAHLLYSYIGALVGHPVAGGSVAEQAAALLKFRCEKAELQLLLEAATEDKL